MSTCVDACLHGCAEIHTVQQKCQASGTLAQTQLKDANDPKSALTEADGAAQNTILQALIHEWGNGLELIGEEEEDAVSSKNVKHCKALGRDLCRDILNQNGDSVQLAIFVNPLDGTREFIKERLSNCQTLIGIALNGTPVAGAMGIPFPDGSLSLEPTVVHGQVGAGHGLIGTPLMKSNTNYEHLP